MKKSLEIILTTLHLGGARRVVTIAINGKDLAQDFIRKLRKSDRAGAELLFARIKAVAERENYENRETFRSLGSNLFEFKTRSGLRLYAFLDEVENLGPQLVIATNGGKKNTAKEQNADIARARSIQERYQFAKSNPNQSSFELIDTPDED